MLASAALLLPLSLASATQSPRIDLPVIGKDISPRAARNAPAEAAEPTDKAESQGGFIINDKTEVKLDGMPCKLADVPKGAEIDAVDLGPDKKTILRISFRSK
jgi:hypothetical protein